MTPSFLISVSLLLFIYLRIILRLKYFFPSQSAFVSPSIFFLHSYSICLPFSPPTLFILLIPLPVPLYYPLSPFYLNSASVTMFLSNSIFRISCLRFPSYLLQLSVYLPYISFFLFLSPTSSTLCLPSLPSLLSVSLLKVSTDTGRKGTGRISR